MKQLFLATITTIFLFTSCDNGMIGKYKKEPLPSDFSYKIIEDNSNATLEKNQLKVEISQKITVEQIATLADKLFSSKPKQRRFYIAYFLPGMQQDSYVWATSDFEPDLDIQILGSTEQEEIASNQVADQPIDGEVIGKWYEEQYTSSNYIILKKDNKILLRTIFKNGQISDVELTEKKVTTGTRYDYKEGGYNGEYFILNNQGSLDFYNKENDNFTTALKK